MREVEFRGKWDFKRIKPTPFADTRTAPRVPTKDELLEASLEHIDNVKQGMGFMANYLLGMANRHDSDKIMDIDVFHQDFARAMETDFKFTDGDWYSSHVRMAHHFRERINSGMETVDELDINLMDVLEMIVDVVMAAKGRGGKVHADIDPAILVRAYYNTVKKTESAAMVCDCGGKCELCDASMRHNG